MDMLELLLQSFHQLISCYAKISEKVPATVKCLSLATDSTKMIRETFCGTFVLDIMLLTNSFVQEPFTSKGNYSAEATLCYRCIIHSFSLQVFTYTCRVRMFLFLSFNLH